MKGDLMERPMRLEDLDEFPRRVRTEDGLQVLRRLLSFLPCPAHHRPLDPPQPLVHLIDGLSAPQRVDERLPELAGVQKSEIDAFAGERGHDVGRVPDESDALELGRPRVRRREGVDLARGDRRVVGVVDEVQNAGVPSREERRDVLTSLGWIRREGMVVQPRLRHAQRSVDPDDAVGVPLGDQSFVIGYDQGGTVSDE